MKNNVFLTSSLLLFFLIASCTQKNECDDTLTLDQKIGQMLVVGFIGTEATPEFIKQLTENNVGGVILFDRNMSNSDSIRNIVNPEQLKRLTKKLQSVSQTPLFIAIDQEGGQKSCLKPANGFYTLPSAQYLGKLDLQDSSRYYARLNALQLSDLGININFAPCVDLNINSQNPIIGSKERAYSDKPERVIEEADILINEYRRQGIITALKHFPGHGNSTRDSHLGLVDITQTFVEEELEPYRVLVQKDKADIVIVGHLFNNNIDSIYPASLSKATIEKLLRKEIGFKGVVATDDMHMGAITKEYSYEKALELAINAGVDMIIIGNNANVYYGNLIENTVDAIMQLVKDGKVSPERIDEAYKRICKLKQGLN